MIFIVNPISGNGRKNAIIAHLEKNGHKVTSDEPKTESFICTDCGTAVPPSMAERTKKAFGVVLCRDCGLKRSEQK